MSDYKNTLNLPETSFPMKANLTAKEPELLAFWAEQQTYKQMVSDESKTERFVLHDGPPYANGHIHLGTALNKILKDIIIKSKNLDGIRAEFVPGWDCHGLPIEHKVAQDLKEKNKVLPANVVRRLCREYAGKWIKVQREEFKRLGVFAEWDEPYLSMNPKYEASTCAELGSFMDSGSLYRSKKPIHWCGDCRTALAEAEVEYYDHSSPAIFVRFLLEEKGLSELFPHHPVGKSYVVIWTTTPWTLPDNQAVAVHADYDYSLVEYEGNAYIIASDLVENVSELLGWKGHTLLGECKGAQLEGLQSHHPFYERIAPLVLAPYVTLDAGTGCVHTAPGHGREDYETGLRYGLEILSPIDDDGRFYDFVPFVGGLSVFDANAPVLSLLKERNALLHHETIHHSYPHCWRCKSPVFFRATTQWFVSMEANHLRKNSLESIKKSVSWLPAWGEGRIYSMIENRPDWCLSRQRTWGVPITALLCEGCGEAWHSGDFTREMAKRFAEHPQGCDYWFEVDVEDITPKDLTCSACGSKKWKKETDILDVWFDSGTSFAAVLEQRAECYFPADLYLEGSDQHRGWFHSSLLVSQGTRGIPPYKSVLTHGYVVDHQGKKMSKSIGNVIAPEEIIKKLGAEILRMWVASVDYREDIKISEEIISRQVDAYRRIRNTCRYLLGNLKDFSIEDCVSAEDMDPLDLLGLDLVNRAYLEVSDAYEKYEFHRVFHTLHNLCVTDLSAFYLDVLKDRLYASAPKSLERRSAQTALWKICHILCTAMAPVLSFTAEEVFRSLSEDLRFGKQSIFSMQKNLLDRALLSADMKELWNKVLMARSLLTSAIEPLRRKGDIGHSLDTRAIIYADDETIEQFRTLKTDLRAVFLVSQLELASLRQVEGEVVRDEEIPGFAVHVSKAKGEKCSRCWIYSEELGSDAEHPELCPRCTKVMQSLEK